MFVKYLQIINQSFSLDIVTLQNYGDHFDLGPFGLDGGPVKLIGNGNLTRDLSTNLWTYKVNYHE